MKKFILVILMFILTLSIGICQDKKQEKNAVYLSVGAFMISQKNEPFKPKTEIRPAINIQYNRILWKGLGVGIGYAFKKANPNAGVDTYIEQTHAILLTPNYRFDIKQFNITPYFAFGICFANFTFPLGPFFHQSNTESYTYYYYFKTKTHPRFMISPGIRFGYDINNWTIFISYNYDYYRCKINEPPCPFPIHRITYWYFPESFGHHCFHIGTGIKF